ncbi:hypothetical protein [Pseudosporangium ferrugineum]|uniref:Uncharacterized protein n=1 Tax=Pseudosporangium ferrugineum TaxID=439699 RepID=A0A2T0S0X8_9ACTN|nr:hypothetical protein [Pseudosporangium ferrugineum]PRY27084.1 hypothetical protein CLV70_11147 [Pseudosporangium ferrugineum]
MYPGAPAPSSRPTVVTVSSYLLYFSAAASVVSALLSLTTISTISDVYRDLYADTADSGLENIIVGVSVVGVAINVLFAVGLVILGLFNGRGRQGSRITTWVIGGIFLCCNGFGLIGNAATSGMNLDTGSTTGPSAREIEQRLSDALPSWYTPITTTLTVVLVLAMLAALILLVLPAANAYFRKPQATWDPSMPYPYPGQPGYPAPGYPPVGYPQPGQPPYPAPASYPPYPGTAEPSTPPPVTPPPGPSDQAPHTGSVPATDPWSVPTPQAPPSPSPSPSSSPDAPADRDAPPASGPDRDAPPASERDAPPAPEAGPDSPPEQPGQQPTDPS